MELDSIRTMKKRISFLENRLAALKTAATAITPLMDGLPHGKARTSPPERFAVAIVDTEQELTATKAAYEENRARLADTIFERMEDNPTLLTILILRYVECLSFRKIASRVHYSLSRVFDLHTKAAAEYERCCG